MPRVPSISPATGLPTPPDFVHTTAGQFVDTTGRTLLLRGINLSGSAKAPVDKPSYVIEGLWDDAEAGGSSFVGRPLNLDDGSADVHLARLRGWGFNMLRYVVTWEAIEHEGPGKYDYEFMDYTVRVLRKCKEYGFRIFMDPHQDVWSRFSGGSGAPFWTLHACGFEPRNFTTTSAAFVHAEYPSPSSPDPASFPAMIWSTNYIHLASLTLFTLFFAGRDYAPKCVLDGVNVQDYLQSHYVAAMGALADRIRAAGDLLDDCVLGWDSLNEPSEGLIGFPDLDSTSANSTAQLKKGPTPTAAQSFRLGMGAAQTVEDWDFGQFGPKKVGEVTIDPRGVRAWADPGMEDERGVHPKWGWTRDPGWKLGTCLWAQHGVWDPDSGAVLEPEYFNRRRPGSSSSSFSSENAAVDFNADYWAPHWRAFAARIRAAHPEAIHFVNPPVFSAPPPLDEADLRGRAAYSAHYYDGLTLVSRHWNWFNADALGMMRGKYSNVLQAIRVGEGAIRKCLGEQLGVLKRDAEILGPYPTLIGEIGIPYDMDGKRAYGRTDGGRYKGDYGRQQRALDASLNATDGANALSYTIWTYCPDNGHEWGDGWNLEDLSVWSPDDAKGGEGQRRYRMSAAELGMGPSTLSLATLKGGGGGPGEEDAEGRWDGLYALLTDGARAPKAFCRPYPVATVGIPSHIAFDIAKAELRLAVRVSADDAPRVASEDASLSTTSLALDKDDDDAPATEIYVPLVHYASDAVLGEQSRAADADADADDDDDGAGAASRAELLPPDARPSQAASSTTLVVKAGEPLALDVEVSAGRWVVEGQTLRWWYPVPAAGEPEVEYTIVVRRRGGAIKTAEEVEAERNASCWGLGEWMCPLEGCVVM